MTLRGTVWFLFNGVPELRRVWATEADSVEEFKAKACALTKDKAAVLEFGPIGPPWELFGA